MTTYVWIVDELKCLEMAKYNEGDSVMRLIDRQQMTVKGLLAEEESFVKSLKTVFGLFPAKNGDDFKGSYYCEGKDHQGNPIEGSYREDQLSRFASN